LSKAKLRTTPQAKNASNKNVCNKNGIGMQSLDLDVLNHLRAWLAEGRRAWLITVTRTFGASPRPPGSMLAMRDDGVLIGSVSGGCIEDDLVVRRAEFVGATPIRCRYGVTADDARRFGLPCGGELEVLVESALVATQIDALLARIAEGNVFFRDVDLATGAWEYRAARSTEETAISETCFACLHGPRWRLLIIGASEISVFLAEIAKTLDFNVFVCDPREEYRSIWRVAGTQFVDGMPDDAVVAFRCDARTVVVAVSHDPKLDDMALMEALKTDAFYVGAVGSARTSEQRRERLQGLDVTPAQVAKLHGPVGLAIGSRTPPEIAVAIAAELVAARNRIALSRVAISRVADAITKSAA
jgi:xanthine dehydrogenase accessory factor